MSRSARSGSGCQWQWHSTRLPSAGSTSTVSAIDVKPKGRPGKKIADNGLQVAVAQAAARLKRSEPRRQSGSCRRVNSAFSLVSGITETRQFGQPGLRAPAVRAEFGAASGDRTHDILSHSQAFCR